MQILLKPEQVEGKHFIHRWNMANDTKPSVNIELLESDFHIINQILWANWESSSLDELWDQAHDNKNED